MVLRLPRTAARGDCRPHAALRRRAGGLGDRTTGWSCRQVGAGVGAARGWPHVPAAPWRCVGDRDRGPDQGVPEVPDRQGAAGHDAGSVPAGRLHGVPAGRTGARRHLLRQRGAVPHAQPRGDDRADRRRGGSPVPVDARVRRRDHPRQQTSQPLPAFGAGVVPGVRAHPAPLRLRANIVRQGVLRGRRCLQQLVEPGRPARGSRPVRLGGRRDRVRHTRASPRAGPRAGGVAGGDDHGAGGLDRRGAALSGCT